MTMIREVGLFLSLLLSLRFSVLAQDSNCLDSKWLPENYIYNPGNECEQYDGSRIPNCSAFIHPGTKEPYYHLHEYDCSKFWECGPAGETCLFQCAPCGALCPGYNGLSFDCRYQYPMGPVCDFPINVECNNHIPCPSCDSCQEWQSCDEGTGCICTPECQVDAHCPDDQYCDQDGECQDGCRSAENCTATVCSDCINHQCEDPDCCADEDCPDGVCLDGSCVECVVDNDCNVDGGCSSCENNQCVAPQCCTDDDCEVGQHCNLGFCEGECNTNDNCPNGGSDALCDVPIYDECQYCNTGSHLCEQGCDADTNCPSDYPVCNPDHTCGCSDTSDCLGSEDICNIDTYDNCAYCDSSNAQCKPGCDTNSNCPADFPVCQDDHTCGCSDGSDCVGNGEVCNTDTYDNCAYCDANNAQCKPGCATDSNCPAEFPVCQTDHTCGCSYPMDCAGNGEICNIDVYDNCAYCDIANSECKPGCVNDANCPTDFPVCQDDHTCGCTADSDCQGSNWICDVEETPYGDCQYCNLDDAQCQPGCIHDFNCPPSYICGEDHLCMLDGECDSIRPCVDDGDVCDLDYSNCFYCDLDSKTCEPGCEENSECVAFGSNYICNPANQCQAVGVSGIINITVSTYTCEGCPSSGGFATEEGGLQVTLDAGMLACSTNGLDNLDKRDYDNGITAFFDADQLEETDGTDDDGMGQCRGADLNLRLEGGTATWTGTGKWTGSSQIPICINFFGEYKPTCCCELEHNSLAQGESTNLVECGCCASPPCN